MTSVVPPATSFDVPHDDDSFAGYADAIFGDQTEFTTPLECDVIGNMPEWLEGSFIRVGPGRFKWGDMEVGHWFDGDAIAHRFSIKDGQVTYQNKFLRTEYRRKNEKYNRISAQGYSTWAPPDPCADIFQRLAMYVLPKFSKNDNAGVNVFDIQGKTYVTTETPWMVEIDKETLDTIKIINARWCQKREGVPIASSTWMAHPHVEEDGTTLFVTTIQGPNPKFQIFGIPPTPGPNPLEGVKLMATLPCEPQGPGYYHSFAITENYYILVENPIYLESLFSFLTMNLCRKTMQEVLKFKPEYGTLFRIIEKKTGKEMRKCIADAFFVFHHTNAFEKDGDLIMDMCRYPDDSIINQVYMSSIKNDFRGQTLVLPNLVRYRVPLSEVHKEDSEPYRFPLVSGEGKDHEVLAPGFEGPVINYKMHNGKPYRFTYGIYDFVYRQRLVKVDVTTKTSLYWNPPDKVVPSIPVFIPNPNGTSEDDGVLVTNCTGVDDVKSFFVVLDAKTMEEVCKANMPVDAVYGIHANFFQH